MQDPKETFNNIEHNTEMALLQSEKIAESVDNLEPIMEGVLVKADDILNEQKKTNELLSKEEEPKPEVQKIELLGAELITIKGKDGENGDKGEKGDKGDTGERGEKGEQGERGDIGKQGEKGEKGDNGDTGKDGIDGLDGKDGKNGKNGKDGSPDTPKQVKEKLLKVGLDYNEIDNTPDINKVINIAVAGVKQSSKTVSLVELDDIDYSGLSIVDGKYVLGGGTGGATWGSITGNIVDQTDLQSALNAKQDSIITGTSAQYLKGDLSLGTFPTNVSTFTNDSGYITSSALTGYVPNTRTLTINGTAYDLSADRSWTVAVPTLTSELTNDSGFITSSALASYLPLTGATYTTTTGNGLALTTSTLTSGKLVSLSSTGTGAGSNTQTVLNIATSGANGTSTQTTYGTYVTNTHTGTASTNVAGYFSASGGTNNYGLIVANGNVGIGMTGPSYKLDVQDTTVSAAQTPVARFYQLQTTNGYGNPVIIRNADASAYSTSAIGFQNAAGTTVFQAGAAGSTYSNAVYPALTANGSFLYTTGNFGMVSDNVTGRFDFQIGQNAAGVKMSILSSGNVGIGTISPTAVLHLKAGTATANKAPLKFTSGTNLTTPEAGVMEYDGTSLFFTPSSTRYNVLMNGLGLAGGQTIIGGTASGNSLTLSSTSNATKGKILFGTSAYDEVNNRLGIGNNTPTATLSVGAGGQYVVVTGTTSPDVSGTYNYVGQYGGRNLYQGGGSNWYIWFNGSSYWYITVAPGNSGAGYYTPTSGDLPSPIVWTTGTGVSGTASSTTMTGGTQFLVDNFGNVNAGGYLKVSGNTGLGGQLSPTAKLHIGAGTATANTAPLKFTSGTNTTVAVAGQIEYNNTFHLTNSDATRRHVVTAPNTTKVTAAAPYTNDGYIIINIGGTDFKVMTTA